MTNEPERIRIEEAARLVGLSRNAFISLAALRGWKSERDPYSARLVTYHRETVEQEAKIRLARNARVTPADLAHAVRCAGTIRAFWAAKGHPVDVVAVGTEIISDLVGGLPVRK